jgi:uncharacterized protein YggE
MKLISIVVLLTSSLVWADERPRVSVTGTCTHSVTPDRGAIQVTAEFRDNDLKVASKKATESYERLREGIQRLGLENLELRTSEYQVSQIREWEKDRQVNRGYRARMGLRVVTSSIQKLGEVIALAARDGIQDVGALETFLSDEKLLQEQMGCIQEATKNAKARAEKLAQAAGGKLGSALSLSDSWTQTSPVVMPQMMMARGSAMSAQDSSPTVEAGSRQISVTVQAVFLLN